MTVSTAVATIHTNHGDIRVELFGNHAPKTVANFIGLANGTQAWTHPETGEAKTTPLYDGVIFHRIIKQFMLQGGDPLGKGIGGPGYEFDDEIHGELTFGDKYVLAMANAGRPWRTRHQRFPVLHHDRADTVAAGQAHHLRRRGRRRVRSGWSTRSKRSRPTDATFRSSRSSSHPSTSSRSSDPVR